MNLRTLFAAALAFAFWAAPASAQMEICNKTAAPFSVAIAYETESDVVSQGWWTVDPDRCEKVIDRELDRPYYYHYAVSHPLNVEWAGSVNFCTSADPTFRINGTGDCEQRNYRTTGFRQIDVGTNKAYTLTISMGPQHSSADEAAPPVVEPVKAAAPAEEPVKATSPTPAAQ